MRSKHAGLIGFPLITANQKWQAVTKLAAHAQLEHPTAARRSSFTTTHPAFSDASASAKTDLVFFILSVAKCNLPA